ncbi:MAG: choice-of-anchor D domain-containing protein, partial [Bacteroidia bacterium]
GTELWKSDGTNAGTVMVKDINPGTAASKPSYLTDINGTLYFTATTTDSGTELWKSDGTEAGTVLVKDINTGAAGSSPVYLTNVNGTLFFAATDVANGQELWKSDGTDAGTTITKDIFPGSLGSAPSNLTATGSTLIFSAYDGFGGVELWKSDGTEAGTSMTMDINPGAGSSFPRNFIVFNNVAFFNAYDDVNGDELWRSDGTPEGTRLIEDIIPGTESSDPLFALAGNSYLIMTANTPNNLGKELWRYDFETSMVVSQASVIIDGSTYDFGTLAEGVLTSEKTFTIKNDGDASLNLTGSPVILLGGTNPSDFIVTQPAGTTLAPGASVTFTVTFATTTSATKTATVQIASNYTGATPFTFTVTGARTISGIDEETVAEPELYPNPAADFVIIVLPGHGDKCRLEIFNPSGSIIKRLETTDRQYNLPVSHFSNGLYIVRISSGGKEYILKMTVRH